ncbi:GNAT family N-acetyltransferase [Colwellia sp. BRX10-3]|uniref:GNAT family N-acetyltransferase n=1 Tax=Colwellia sp. BRX10-3 TaxID=2759844 RepID=UPI0015F4D527|nr:GNAT family N-acetyltransferase [Colwellia sp. BRX10-3]MBA6390944.1 GNAT family N-acetyltransferase [Colwellia sp. BRX10-3]
MNIVVNRARIENINEVSILFNSYRVFYDQDSNLELAKEFISERINNNESVIFYAIDNTGAYLGFTQLYPNFSSVSAKRSWVLNDLYVSESARRLGVGKKLMQAAKNFALSTNAKGIALETAEDNVNAQALYESLGYKKGSGFFSYFLSLPQA